MTGPEMRSPVPRANAENRAKGNRNEAFSNIGSPEPEADFAALYIARRYRLSPCVAHAVAVLAGLGRAFG